MKIKTERVVAAGVVAIGIYLIIKHRGNAVNNETNISGRMSSKTVKAGANKKPGILQWPTDYHKVTSHFGLRSAPTQGASTKHNGIDISVPEPSPVYAPAKGIVEKIWIDNAYGGGLSMRIKHANGLVTGFAHLSNALDTRVGQTVGQGDLIAESGGTPGSYGAGMSTGPHLHFTVRENGVAVDPMIYLPEESIS